MEQDVQRAHSQAPRCSTRSTSGGWTTMAGRMAELHGALNAATCRDGDLRAIVDDTLTHHDELFRLKPWQPSPTVLHLITGVWTTPCRASIPWTEQQLVGICNLQQSSQQAEEALSQLTPWSVDLRLIDANMSFMGQMALASASWPTLKIHRILTVRQAARCFLAIGEYHNRLRALSSLWASRSRE
ncbi:hypothetical protein HU200_030293 [Digitaria exilis]|uniref:DOG1 domain-containing protein n=1 Tax=Digitaria exilis TaxID=1010633 RepID=A0A835EQY2_9POAL|nr:hypothetical protein HU200_030293 [Digitaria exilis]